MINEDDSPLRVETIFLILAFLFMPMDSLFSTARLGQDLSPSKIFIALAFGFFFVRAVLVKDLKKLLAPFKHHITILFLLFLLVSLISIANSRYSADPTYQNPLFLLFRRVSFFVFYFTVIVIVYDNYKIFKYALAAFLFASAMSCLAGLYEIITKKPFLSEQHYADITSNLISQAGSFRVSGLEVWAGIQASLLSMLFPFLLQTLFTSKRRIVRFTIGAVILLYLINIVGNGSRTGWIAMAIAVSVYFFFALKGRERLLYFATSSLLVLIVFVSLALFTDLAIAERLNIGKKRSGTGSIVHRKTHIEMSFNMIRDYPVLGIGTGNFLNAHYHYTTLMNSPPVFVSPSDSHNAYLQIWSENGIVGLIIFLTLLSFVLSENYTSIRAAPENESRLMACACLASIASLLWLLALEPLLDGKYFWSVIAMSVALSNIIRSAKERGSISP